MVLASRVLASIDKCFRRGNFIARVALTTCVSAILLEVFRPMHSLVCEASMISLCPSGLAGSNLYFLGFPGVFARQQWSVD